MIAYDTIFILFVFCIVYNNFPGSIVLSDDTIFIIVALSWFTMTSYDIIFILEVFDSVYDDFMLYHIHPGSI
jgi:hypothetical protein